MIRLNKLDEVKICDAYLIVSQVNRCYFSGFDSTFGYVVYAGGQGYFITDKRYGEEARAFFAGQNIKVLDGDAAKANEFLKEILDTPSVKTIGYEDNRISCRDFRNLTGLLDKEFTAAGKEIDSLRRIKDEYELTQIEAAQKIAEKAFTKTLGAIKGGVTERDIWAELSHQLLLNGADAPAFDIIVASGKNSALPHATVTKRKIESGDFIVIDFGAKYNGYLSDTTRTVAVGKPDPEKVKVYETVLKAQNLAINALKAGITCREIFNIANSFLSAYGYEKQFLHGLGHAIGVEVHERPYLNNESVETLEKNMVIAVEPGVYIEKSFGVRIEDLVVIKENGIKNLTSLDKKLVIL
jgi:Xaa-Pro aminopeptidase